MSSIPAVLASPPWVPARKRAKLTIALAPREERIVWWSASERDEWTDPAPSVGPDRDTYATMSPDERDRTILEAIASARILPIYAGRHLSKEALLLALEKASPRFVAHYRLAHIALAKFGLDVLDGLLGLFARAPDVAFDCFRRVDSLRVAELLESKHMSVAVEWFDRYPRTAAARLLPTALTGNAKDSKRATKAIATLLARGHEEAVFAEASAIGEDAVTELRALLAPPSLPPKPPKLPEIFDVSSLPVLFLSGSDTKETLGPEHVERLGQLLALLPLLAARNAVLAVKEACDPTSLADFTRALVDRWSAAGAPTDAKWVLMAAALLGDDLVAHQLAERIAEWAGAGLHTRSAAGVEALGMLGSDVALMHLARFAEKSKAKPLKKRARAELDAFKEEHELSEEELADRLVPDLGLDARGRLDLSYGPRSFQVVFDESLRPTLLHDGKPLRSLPRPDRHDDASLAERAQATWQALKTESKALADGQVRRLERAMSRQRRWSAEAFEQHHRRHPLMQHFARRLVWGVFDTTGGLSSTFRVAEDGSLASADDEELTLPPGASIGIVHPLLLGTELVGRWGAVFGDYAIVQPFPQLGRELFVLTDEEKAASTLTRHEGVHVPGGRFFSLKHRGWEFLDYGISKRLSGNRFATLSSQPGLYFLAYKPDDQTLNDITLRDPNGELATFDVLNPIETSELVRDIEMLRR